MNKSDQKNLIDWYKQNHRPLPWRSNRDPYKIWISETMLQQTTSKAVIPYFERFIKALPHVDDLAQAKESTVLNLWSGLGYYSRARNLHKAAKAISALQSFPESHQDLIELPGFGPYTSRAVSSLAFSESVGVLDGNVIRVLTRKENLFLEWWKTKERRQLQDLADLAVKGGPSEIINQALMELGATICLPQNPKCMLCPWIKSCKGFKENNESKLPLKKPKKAQEIWVWQAEVVKKGSQVLLVKNQYAPFLKNQWILPGKVKKQKLQPKSYDYKHTITHHNIYVKTQNYSNAQWKIKGKSSLFSDTKWVSKERVSHYSPTSLIKKALSCIDS